MVNLCAILLSLKTGDVYLKYCFYGTHEYQLDAKNRMRMPAKFRAEMGDEYLITKGAGGSLFVLHQKALEELNEKISALPLTDVEAGKVLRKFTSSAVRVECDEQGRFVLPSTLKEYAKIDKNVCIVGAGSKVEIWSQEIWDEINRGGKDENFDDVLGSLAKYGI